jgi:hypothetical protein
VPLWPPPPPCPPVLTLFSSVSLCLRGEYSVGRGYATEFAGTLVPGRIAPLWPLPPPCPPVLTLFPSASLCLLRNKILDLLELKDFAFCAFQPTHAPSRLSFSPSKPGPLGQLLRGESSTGTLVPRRIAPPWPLPPPCPPVLTLFSSVSLCLRGEYSYPARRLRIGASRYSIYVTVY